MPSKAMRRCQTPWSWSFCELHDRGAGNQPWVSCKNSKLSQALINLSCSEYVFKTGSHLESPKLITNGMYSRCHGIRLLAVKGKMSEPSGYTLPQPFRQEHTNKNSAPLLAEPKVARCKGLLCARCVAPFGKIIKSYKVATVIPRFSKGFESSTSEHME